MQKSIIVCGKDNDELDRYIAGDWKVVSMCAMPSSCSVQGNAISNTRFEPQCLVILEKQDK